MLRYFFVSSSPHVHNHPAMLKHILKKHPKRTIVRTEADTNKTRTKHEWNTNKTPGKISLPFFKNSYIELSYLLTRNTNICYIKRERILLAQQDCCYYALVVSLTCTLCLLMIWTIKCATQRSCHNEFSRAYKPYKINT